MKLNFTGYEVEIKNGKLTSNLERKAVEVVDQEFLPVAGEHTQIWDEYTSAMDGFEATILALAEAGFNLNEPKMKNALQTALDAIDNHYSEE